MSQPSNGYHVIKFKLNHEPQSDTIDFLPYGTRTLKIKVENPGEITGNLVLRSESLPEGFGEERFYSHEEGGTDFRVSWGGGHEKGACVLGEDDVRQFGPLKLKVPFEKCVPLPKGESSFVYLNVTHTGGSFDQERRLLLTVRPEEQPPSSEPVFKMEVRLTPPKRELSDPVRLTRGDDPTSFSFAGTQVPSYISRWWSPKDVQYSAAEPPGLRFTLEDKVLNVSVRNGAGDGSPEYKVIARLQDSIGLQDIVASNGKKQARAFDADLFHFSGDLYVLRVWFFWLWQAGIKTYGNEIPDAERFDFLINTRLNLVTYAATDLHWRESWSRAPGNEPVKARIGLFSGSVLQQMLGKLGGKMKDYLKRVDKTKEKEHAGSGDAIYDPVAARRRALEGKEFVYPVGLEAHVPSFDNCYPPDDDMISSDPRDG